MTFNMKTIQEVLVVAEYRCDGCSRKLSEFDAELLPLFERGFGIRKSKENCLLVCKDAVKSLQEYSLRDQFLLLSGHYGVFKCPCKPKARVKKEVKTTKQSTSSVKSAFLDKISNVPRHVHEHIPNTPSTGDPTEENQGFNIQRVQLALAARALTATQIRQLLERSVDLQLTSEMIASLDTEYNRLLEDSRNRGIYTVDPEGVVSFAAARSKLPHDFLNGKKEKWASNKTIYPAKSKPGKKLGTTVSLDTGANNQTQTKRPPRPRYIRCSHCKSFMYYTDANSEKCRNCKRPFTS